MIRYHLKQRLPDGTLWMSEEQDPATIHGVKQAVIAGFLTGQTRWAETIYGDFLFALNGKGQHFTDFTSFTQRKIQ